MGIMPLQKTLNVTSPSRMAAGSPIEVDKAGYFTVCKLKQQSLGLGKSGIRTNEFRNVEGCWQMLNPWTATACIELMIP